MPSGATVAFKQFRNPGPQLVDIKPKSAGNNGGTGNHDLDHCAPCARIQIGISRIGNSQKDNHKNSHNNSVRKTARPNIRSGVSTARAICKTMCKRGCLPRGLIRSARQLSSRRRFCHCFTPAIVKPEDQAAETLSLWRRSPCGDRISGQKGGETANSSQAS